MSQNQKKVKKQFSNHIIRKKVQPSDNCLYIASENLPQHMLLGGQDDRSDRHHLHSKPSRTAGQLLNSN